MEGCRVFFMVETVRTTDWSALDRQSRRIEMASYTIDTGNIAAHAKDLVASTVDTVTFGTTAGSGTRGDQSNVEIIVHTAVAPVYFTTDGSTPTVAGGNTNVILSGGSVLVKPRKVGATVIKLICVGVATYSVVGVN